MDDSFDMRRLVARLRFRHLQMLVELQEGGSLRAAAAVLNLTQPALSKALSEVESAFGFRLFERGARGLVPTLQGLTVIRGATLLLQELAHVGAEAAAEPTTTLLRVGAPPFVAEGLLPEVFAKLLSPWPGGSSEDVDNPAITRSPRHFPVRIQVKEERVPLLVDLLLQGQLDALVTSYPAEMPESAGQPLHFEKLFEVAYVVIAPAGHPLTRARRIHWARLVDEPWIMPPAISLVRRVMEDAFRREGIVTPRPLVESISAFTNLRFVAAGLGLGAVPESTLRSARANDEVQRVRVQPPLRPAPVALISRAGVDNPRVDLLRNALRSAGASIEA